jgi:hypothetical protein
MKNKQTAVGWLQDKLFELEIKIDPSIAEETFFLFAQAKQMEKEQMIDAHGSKNRGGFKSNGEFFLDILTGEQYYNETYNNLNK